MAKKSTLLFLTGYSYSGKGYLAEKIILENSFYKLLSAASRKMRPGEKDGVEYMFRDEKFFDENTFATKIWADEDYWQPGDPKQLYGVTEKELFVNLGRNLIYDVIEPRYVRQMIDWFKKNKLDCLYDFKIAYLLPVDDYLTKASERATMPHDGKLRKTNTCEPIDFLRAGIHPDWFVKSSPEEFLMPSSMIEWLAQTSKTKKK
jgi:hypothetical protein